MALTKEQIVDKIETLEDGCIHVRTATVIKDDGVEVTRTLHRHTLEPCIRSGENWVDTDISSEDPRTQAICNAVWTDEVKTSWQNNWDEKD